MRQRGIITVLLIGASALALIAAPATGQPPPPPPSPSGSPSSPAVSDRQMIETLRGLLLMPRGVSTSEKECAGLSEQAPAEVLTWDRVYTLALVRARSSGATAAESLDPKALAEGARRHDIADFGRFRKEFLAGGAGAGGASRDPSGAYFAVLYRLQAIEDARADIATLENLSRLVQELIRGESAGLSQLEVNLIAEVLVRAGRAASTEITQFRDELDALKVSLGLSPHAAVIPDRRALAPFRDVFLAGEVWATRPDRRLDELARIVGRLPAPGDAIVDGRPILDPIEQDPGRMEDTLADAVRTAIKNRGGDKDPAAEDRGVALELRVRRRVRHLLDTRRGYEDAKRGYLLTVRLRDQSFESVVAPPVSALVGAVKLTTALTRLIADQGRIRDSQDRVVERWTTFRSERLALYRDLGTLPYDNWEAFYADLSAVQAAAAPPPTAPATPPPPAGTPGR